SLEVDDKAELEAEWDSDDDLQIEWSATGDEGIAELGSDGAKLYIKALKEGSITITATIKGSSIKAECELEIS
ncbi:MAG: cell adhesion domain-containing protein, partial [Oscillospiraceae bacterium]|nr:cell adhesion domain-containing protein [Oscillospiraceae bacterium]